MKKLFLSTLVATLITGCNQASDNSDTDSGTGIPPFELPKITALSIDGDYKVGEELSALVECDSCDSYSVSWYLDGKLRSINPSFELKATDMYKAVNLEVVGGNSAGQDSARALAYPEWVASVSGSRNGFMALTNMGKLVVWGNFSKTLPEVLSEGTHSAFSIIVSQAAIHGENKVLVTWPSYTVGPTETLTGIEAVFSTRNAFAALSDKGRVSTWGSEVTGGDSSEVEHLLQNGVINVFSNDNAFAALREEGRVVTWGWDILGGDSSAVEEDLGSGVEHIVGNEYAFAAIKQDGRVVTWGHPDSGGDSADVSAELSRDVLSIVPSNGAFAALKQDGSVVTWGKEYLCIDDPDNSVSFDEVKHLLSSDVVDTQSHLISNAFAALKDDGQVITWGCAYSGGNSSSVEEHLETGVVSIATTAHTFAALKDDGSVVTWGLADAGGDSSSVADELGSGVTEIVSSSRAYAALKADGSVVTWGDSKFGGDSSLVAEQLQSDVIEIIPATKSFTAIKSDNKVVTWGDETYGGDSSEVADLLKPSLKVMEASLTQ